MWHDPQNANRLHQHGEGEITMIKWIKDNLYDEKWQAACNDVYDYDKGEIYD